VHLVDKFLGAARDGDIDTLKQQVHEIQFSI